jgi:radical SAM-linked protein
LTYERYVDPVTDFGGLLLKVEKPARYTGGEVGSLSNKPEKKNAIFRTLIAFPDLYEIGMGNQALRIIYNRLNNMQGILCDRAFAPAPDFEKLLRETNIPLYGLETGLGIAFFDIVMFTIGYELGLNGVLLMLDVSQIPLRCIQRRDEHPVIIAGGPVVSNPLPFSPFIDAFWIGEAEAGFFDLAEDLAQLKESGQGRAGLLGKISSHPNIWVKGKETAYRAIYSGFSFCDTQAAVYPVPSMKIVHNHGSVEIMRGCPNGCRFCHAGFWYRPMRQQSIEQIISHVTDMVIKGGWQEISLSSLSSGDYFGVNKLVEHLNNLFSPLHISFQMPSLKVSGFSIDLLEKIASIRKSGLTFAVETPVSAWQMSINKEVTREYVFEILEEAKKRGWKGAKFYFMIGLPISEYIYKEEEEIVNFIIYIGRRTRMHFNINIGIFVPKAHTPYQFVPQINSISAKQKFDFIRSRLKPLGHKVSISDTVVSQIEGMISRGDERAGVLCETAYIRGSRLDAWSEYIDKTKWQNIIEDNCALIDNFLSGNCFKKPPWDVIDSCVTKEFLIEEYKKSESENLTLKCIEKCTYCGVCSKNIKIIMNTVKPEKQISKHNSHTAIIVNRETATVNNKKNVRQYPEIFKVLYSFSKSGSAVFHGHLSLIEIFSMAFRRLQLPVIYTQGYNPLIKIEFASPLSVGINAENEFASIYFLENINFNNFLNELNMNLPCGIIIKKADTYLVGKGEKKHSLPSLLWGFSYISPSGSIDFINTKQEKEYRNKYLKSNHDQKSALINLKRYETFARNVIGGKNEWASYFDVYRFLYPK